MSLPTAATAVVASAAIAMNPLDLIMNAINTNPYFIGLMMLLLNLGGRFLSLEISKDQEKFLSKPLVRRFFLFAILFVATRNIVIAAGLSFIMIIVIGYLFNENSDLCLWKNCTEETFVEKAETTFVGLTAEEAMILKRLQDKQMAAQQLGEKGEKGEKEPDAGAVTESAASNLYYSSLTKLSTLIGR
jgi:hypothetical protein